VAVLLESRAAPQYKPVMPFQTLSEIREILLAAGMRPRRRHGQHFLIDRNLMHKLVDAARIGPDDVVLEIGTGTGSLTNLLAERAAHVLTVEIDAQIAEVARRHLAHHHNVTLLTTDALMGKNHLNPRVVEALLDKRRRKSDRCLLVANLPYNAAAPIVADLVLDVPQVRTLCFTVQKEVADRMAAEPATSDYGPLSVVLQGLASVKRIARVPRQAFWPEPEVESAIVRIEPDDALRAASGDPRRLAAVTHRLFLHRRKTLWQNLKLAYGEQPDALKAAVAIDWRRRPEQLAVADWIVLAKVLPPAPTP
jgi:16S rRNA (adenine1518-N6/adenine1519-N6)-dimethyltransferase